MKQAAFSITAMASALALAGCAEVRAAGGDREAAEAPERQCFFARQVTGFRSPEDAEGRRDETRVLIEVGARDTYEFELLRRCPGLRHARRIELVRQGPGRICDGLDVDLVVPEDISPLRCPVTMVRKLPAEDPQARAGARD